MKLRYAPIAGVLLLVCLQPALAQSVAQAVEKNRIAVREIDSGNHAAAVRLLEEAIRLEPKFAKAHYNLGTAFFGLGDFDAAIGAFREAIRIRPDFAEAYNNLAVAFLETGRFTEAVDILKKAMKLKNGNGDIVTLVNLGYAYLRLGKERPAETALRSAIEKDPGNEAARFYLGCTLYRQKRYNDALSEIVRAAASNPDAEPTQLMLVNLYLLTGKRDAAIARYAAFKTSNPPLAAKMYDAIYAGRLISVEIERR